MPDDTSNQSTAAVPTLTMRVRTSWNHWAWFVPTIAVVVAMRARYIGPPFLADEGAAVQALAVAAALDSQTRAATSADAMRLVAEVRSRPAPSLGIETLLQEYEIGRAHV